MTLLPAEDIGDIPLELLQPVLLRCYAEQLAAIEDGTRKGLYLNRASYTKTYVQMDFVSLHRNGGRELHEALQPHWQRVYTAEFGNGSCASSQVCHLLWHTSLQVPLCHVQYTRGIMPPTTVIMFAFAYTSHIFSVTIYTKYDIAGQPTPSRLYA